MIRTPITTARKVILDAGRAFVVIFLTRLPITANWRCSVSGLTSYVDRKNDPSMSKNLAFDAKKVVGFSPGGMEETYVVDPGHLFPITNSI